MSSARFLNQAGPFWDFIASLDQNNNEASEPRAARGQSDVEDWQNNPLANMFGGHPGRPHHRNHGGPRPHRGPPPPPPPAAKAAEDMYKAKYEFSGQAETELSLQEGEVVVVTQKADNGMLCLYIVYPLY